MKTILITVQDFEKLCPKATTLLKENGYELIINSKGYPFDFDSYKDALSKADIVIAGIEKWSAAQFDYAPNLHMIVRFGTGIDNIDCEEATSRGIVIERVIGGNTNAVAEQTIALIYGCLKKLPMLDRTTKEGKWYRPMCQELSGKKLGFIGFGKIPQLIAYKLKTSEVDMVTYDPFIDDEIADELGVGRISMESLLKECDIVSLHLPLMKDTRGLISEEKLYLMKSTSYIINTARGEIINQNKLIELLAMGKLAGAGLDVFCEPQIGKDSEFELMDNVICSPYISARTEQSFERTGLIAANIILSSLN